MHLNLSVQEAVSSKLALYLDFVHRLFMLLASEYVVLPQVSILCMERGYYMGI
jgi:hypothetical protein